MKRILIVTSILAMLLAIPGAVYADPDVLTFRARLSGAREVPPVTTDTTGVAMLEANSDLTRIAFTLVVNQATDIMAVAGAHIHCAPAGQNGPVVAFLAGPVEGGFDGAVRMRAVITTDNIVDPSCGSTIEDLVKSMRMGKAYVNVHSAANPGGEVRGQIRKVVR